MAEASLRHLGIAPTVNGAPPVIVAGERDEEPRTSTRFPSDLKTDQGLRDDSVMPDLRGLSAREANRRLTRLGMSGLFSGDGFVLEQSPAAGSAAVPGTACVLTLGRQPPQRAGAHQ